MMLYFLLKKQKVFVVYIYFRDGWNDKLVKTHIHKIEKSGFEPCSWQAILAILIFLLASWAMIYGYLVIL
jgi:hypothetical protein